MTCSRTHSIVQLCLAVTLFTVCSIHSTQSADDNSQCESIRSSNHSSILCVGELNHRLLLLTTDYQVYDLPKESLQSGIHKLYLNTAPPVALQTKWPVLYESEDFQRAKNSIINGFTFVKGESIELLHLFTQYEDVHFYGVNYDLVANKASSGYTSNGSRTMVMLSNYNSEHFYAVIHDEKTGGLNISLWTRIGEGHIKQDVEYFPFCVGEQKDQIIVDTCGWSELQGRECQVVNWAVSHGFVSGGKIYLFGPNDVTIFDESVWNNFNMTDILNKPTTVGKSVPFTKTTYDSFIECKGNVKDIIASDKAPLSVGLIIGIVLAVLLLLLCCLLFLFQSMGASKNKKPKSRSGGNSSSAKHSRTAKGRKSRSASKLPSTKRSANSFQPGGLSKQQTSSRKTSMRTTRSGGVSKLAQRLSAKNSRKASGKSAARTGRSGLSARTAK